MYPPVESESELESSESESELGAVASESELEAVESESELGAAGAAVVASDARGVQYLHAHIHHLLESCSNPLAIHQRREIALN